MSLRKLLILAGAGAAALAYHLLGTGEGALVVPSEAVGTAAAQPWAAVSANTAYAAPSAASAGAATSLAAQAPSHSDGLRPEPRRQELASQLAAALARDATQDLRTAIHSLSQQCDIIARNPCLDALLELLPADQQNRLRDILHKLPQLQARLSELQMTTQQPMQERLEAISAVRREVMGADNAALLYGREESYLRYQTVLDQFILHDALAMPLAQRLRTAEAIRERELAAYLKGDLRPGEGADLRYQATLALTLLDATDDATRQALARQVRAQFFNAATVDQMARNEAFDAQQRQRAEQYKAEKQVILARFVSVHDASSLAQRDAELDALRQRLFADSFTP